MRCENCGHKMYGSKCRHCGASAPWDTPDGTPFPNWREEEEELVSHKASRLKKEEFAEYPTFEASYETTRPASGRRSQRRDYRTWKQPSAARSSPDQSRKKGNKIGSLVAVIVVAVLVIGVLPDIVGVISDIVNGFGTSESYNYEDYDYYDYYDEQIAEDFDPAPKRAENPEDGYGYNEPVFYSDAEYEQIIENLKNPSVPVEAVDYTLTAGNYIAGVDLAPGIYTVDVTGYNGELYTNNYSKTEYGLNAAYYDIEGEEPAPTHFDTVYLPAGTILEISGPIQAQLHTDSGQVSAMESPLPNEEAQEMTLGNGNYTVGTDIPAGIYDLEASGEQGNVYRSSDEHFDLGINEIMEGMDGEYSVRTFQNLTLLPGDVLEIDCWDEMEIHLIPSH